MDEEKTTNNTEETDLDQLFDDVFTPEPAQEPEKQDKVKDAPKPQQDAAENARQAAGRRARERDQLIEQARAAERARLDELLKSIGIERSDGSTIASVEELEAFERQASDDRIAQGKANAEDIKRIAREAVQPTQNGSDEVQRQLELIKEMDPTLTDLGAILSSDIGQDFRQAVEKGATFIQAYGSAMKAQNARAKGEASTAAAKAAGKQHLSSTNQRGNGALDVPADEMALYCELNPEMTEKEIRDHYNKYRKQTG
ncbi:MAG: hypothetical protein J6Y48_20970 [Clostridia bacterium]|nr:hypothetical protein [Clostridia bacterium]